MEYTDDILARIRDALTEYHAATGHEGRKRSWSKIAFDLYLDFIEAPDLDDEDEDRFADPNKSLGESLRRFVLGTQVPAPERLKAISQYLMGKGYLSEDDLRPGEKQRPFARVFAEFLGSNDKASSKAANRIKGHYQAVRRKRGQLSEISILRVAESSGPVFDVEDTEYSQVADATAKTRAAIRRALRRTGGSELRYEGWLFHWNGQTCLALKDSLGRDAPRLYTVIRHQVLDKKDSERLFVIKSNDFGYKGAGYEMELMPGMSAGVPVTLVESTLASVRDNLWEFRKEPGHGD